MSCYQVVQQIIKPQTIATRCRYVELIQPSEVGMVDSFLSHCWGNKFGDLVCAAGHNARPGRRYWCDIFAVNQHTEASEEPIKLRRRKGKIKSSHPFVLRADGVPIHQFQDDLSRLPDVIRAAKVRRGDSAPDKYTHTHSFSLSKRPT